MASPSGVDPPRQSVGASHPEVDAALTAAFEGEWARLVARTIRATGDWDLAEDAASGAFERAARAWPRDGVPLNPGAWLSTTARNLATDRLRRRSTERARLADATPPPAPADPADLAVADRDWDDRLSLIFTCAHPALALDARVALTLRAVGGLTTAEVARAFLVSEQTMAQRIVRAKRKIVHAAIPYRVPPLATLPSRLDGVLAVLYLVHTEGYAASSGPDLQRPDLSVEAVRLVRLVRELLPGPEVDGLLALMLLQHARSRARTGPDGDLVPLEQQDRSLWDADETAEGLALLGAAPTDRSPYWTQAQIQAVHARAPTAADTDWLAICALYAALPPTPVVELNRAVAMGMAYGPDVGLGMLAELESTGELANYPLLPAAQADLSRRAGHLDAAERYYRAAIELAPTDPERRYLAARLAGLSNPGPPAPRPGASGR